MEVTTYGSAQPQAAPALQLPSAPLLFGLAVLVGAYLTSVRTFLLNYHLTRCGRFLLYKFPLCWCSSTWSIIHIHGELAITTSTRCAFAALALQHRLLRMPW